ncbi:MAG: DUF1836 domain-containing protein [Clostridiales bacterium]|nr:DUF1836 domain-containing protein [Clostridiales bacterium]
MAYDKEQVVEKLLYWKDFMQQFHLPTWEELPDLELYMDQVVALVSRYVNLQPHSGPPEPLLTPSAVNNYGRLKLIPPPVKKRYSRVHLAYLIVICCLKSSMSLSSIQQMFPVDMTPEEVCQAYGRFVSQYRAAYLKCVVQVEQLAAPVLDPQNRDPDQVDSLVLGTAVAAALCKLVTDKLLALQLPKEEPQQGGNKS